MLSGLVAAAAAVAHTHYEWHKALARDAGVPQAVAASELGEVRGFPWFDEVAVQVQFAPELVYLYWETAVDGTTVEFPIMFFVDPDHDGPVREVLGAIAFDSYDADAMGEYLGSVELGEGAVGTLHELTGIPQVLPYVTADEVEWAAHDLGVTMSENFLYLDPHFMGRDVRIAARPELTYIAGGVAVGLIWLSMIVAIIKRRLRDAEVVPAGIATPVRKGLVAAGSAGFAAVFGDEEDI